MAEITEDHKGQASHPFGCHTWRATGITIFWRTMDDSSTRSRWPAITAPDQIFGTSESRSLQRRQNFSDVFYRARVAAEV
jgi:hypothetical protein